ncbi:hypothetical protein Syun_013749 [Stephania yunnanensis]|uniref:Peroxidase n=1 Tax=Stephania yunnanensis TaxID=152371 RepID=A0AAP0JIF8_9MAGN
MASSSVLPLLLFSSLLLLSLPLFEAQRPPIVRGLSWTFYRSSCPNVEKIVRDHLKDVFRRDITQAAGLLRIHFHDCFVRGCDGSVLLAGSEQEAPPNLSLRKEAFTIINDLRAKVHQACGRVVSCADIVAIAARDSVELSGGPKYRVPLGRKDGQHIVTLEETLRNLPPFFGDTSTVLGFFTAKNLDLTDLVALSGGHTIGVGHCSAIVDRLYPVQDPIMERNYADRLKILCPFPNSTEGSFPLDLRSPNRFDNKYYVDLMNRQSLFRSDQDLYTDTRTKPIVEKYAVDEKAFLDQFVASMVKMGQLSVLTGGEGEIRANCSVRNSPVRMPEDGGDDELIRTLVSDGDEIEEDGMSAAF